MEERSSERHRRVKSESKRAHRSSRPKLYDPETGEVIRRPHRRRKEKSSDTASVKGKEADSEPVPSMADLVPELSRTSSAPGAMSRSSLPYPSFSKAHSKEAVNSIENLPIRPPSKPKNPYTPEPTDLGSDGKPHTTYDDRVEDSTRHYADTGGRPPSPSDTEVRPQSRKVTPSRFVRVEEGSRPVSGTSQRSGSVRMYKDERSKLSSKSKESKRSKASTALRTPGVNVTTPVFVEIVEDDASDISEDARSESAIDSNATSVAPKRGQPIHIKPSGLAHYSSPESIEGSSPRTPTATPGPPHHNFKPSPSPFVSFDLAGSQDEAYDSPQPPPPPPPPMVPISIPRVDYLIQNGGLPQPIPKNLIAVTPQYNPQTVSGKPVPPAPQDVEKVFAPYFSLLDQYEQVIAKNGSLAVATGYRSVARRLIDRLDAVFARDLLCEGCHCVICQQNDQGGEGKKGLSWGEVLEWVSGRRELPIWPAFDFSTVGLRKGDLALGISGLNGGGPGRPGSTVAIDPDIAEEYRDHYLRQSKKTKHAVDKWLNSTPGQISAPPPDVDDETLTFTILTHLDQHDRPLFQALLTGASRPTQPGSRAPTPMGQPRSDFIIKSGQSIQRVYRLAEPPRDPEACIYLLRNPHVHHLLATVACINQSEWEILTSGRFDGFLWSGAEAEFPASMLNSPAASRNPTPAPNMLPSRGPTPAAGRHPSFSRIGSPLNFRNHTFSPGPSGYPSRGPTPANIAPMSIPGTPAVGQNRGPVSNDEEAEIAVLSEIEREIYLGMEALEDAFEALHRKAEVVRQALRIRGAGLSMASQARRAGSGDHAGIFARLGTPGMGGAGGFERGWSGTDGGGTEVAAEESDGGWGGDDVLSELAPDDSASNISSSRVRRPKRRNERRTPAPVEECDESDV
jgi:hypothetical protein